MFGIHGFAQPYFGQGPPQLGEPIEGPIRVEDFEQSRPQALRMSGKKARATGLRAKRPNVTNTEQH